MYMEIFLNPFLEQMRFFRTYLFKMDLSKNKHELLCFQVLQNLNYSLLLIS